MRKLYGTGSGEGMCSSVACLFSFLFAGNWLSLGPREIFPSAKQTVDG